MGIVVGGGATGVGVAIDAAAPFVAPRLGFGLICGALILHLRPEAPRQSVVTVLLGPVIRKYSIRRALRAAVVFLRIHGLLLTVQNNFSFRLESKRTATWGSKNVPKNVAASSYKPAKTTPRGPRWVPQTP